MAIGRNSVVARQLATLFNVGVTGTLTDGQLLERFAARRGEAAELAFAALVERHGPLVLRVCRSILRDEAEAHDAFQATFLVLVRKARGLRVCDSLGPWLHSVAHRVALCARASKARRRRLELRRAERVEPARMDEGAGESEEWRAILHEEIERLPERYRAPIVLCDLEGRSHDEAARHLGWPVGTVKSRQARGRDRLRPRLVRRGLAPSIGLVAMASAGAEAAPVPVALARATAQVATRAMTSGLGATSARVASLAKEVSMHFMLGRLKWSAAALLALVLAAVGAWETLSLAGGPPAGGRLAVAPNEVEAQAEPARDGPGKIYLGQDEGMVAIDPKTGEATRVLIRCNIRSRVSPDGKLVAFGWDDAIWVRELDRIVEPRKLLGLDGANSASPPVWSSDSSKLIISLGRSEAAKHEPWRFKTVRINADGSGREDLNQIPTEDGVQDWSVDDLLVTTSSRNAKIGWELYVMRPDGSGQRQITEGGNPFYTRISPDGKRVLYTDGTTEERRGIWVVGVDGQDRRKVLSVGRPHSQSACWSPDGKRIAAIVFEPKDVELPKGRLIILEVDGEGRTEFSLEGVKPADMPDWR